MSDFLNNLIDLNTDDGIEGFDDFDNIPKGDYAATITSAIHTATKSGNGMLVKVEFVLDESSRKAWANYNVENPNQRAQALGRHELKTLILACGMEIPEAGFSPESLEGQRVMITIDHQKNGDRVWDRVKNPQPISASNRQAEAPATGKHDWE